MKINEIGKLGGTQPLKTSGEERQRIAAASDTQSLSSLASMTLRESSASPHSVRSLAELKASLTRAESADPAEIANALLSRGFLTEDWQ